MNTFDTALLLADRSGSELEPVNQFYPPALLPIAGKSPLEYWIEILSGRGIRKAYIVVGPSSLLIKKRLGTGSRWGIKITYLTSRGDEKPIDLFLRHRSVLPADLLAVRADVLPFLGANGEISLSVRLSAETQKNTRDLLSRLSWDQINTKSQEPTNLGNFHQYATAIWNTLDGTYPWLTPRGLNTASSQWLATTEFPTPRVESMKSAVYVGKSVIIHRDTTLANNLSVEEKALVDRGATVENSIILPGTYVGQNFLIKDSIVCGNFLVNINTGLVRQVSDPAMISHLEQPNTMVSTCNSECMIAGTALMLTAPVALSLAILMKTKGQALLRADQAMSNQGSRKNPLVFKHYSFNTRINWLRRWPALLNVIDGDLKLLGAPMATVEQKPLINLPLVQGVITLNDLFPEQQFDKMELELWGIELASENIGFCRQFKRVLYQILKNRLGLSWLKSHAPDIHRNQ